MVALLIDSHDEIADFFGNKKFHGSFSVEANPGPEKVTNGSFTGGSTGWTLTAGWTYNTNAVDKNGDGTTTLSQDVSAVANEVYKVVYTVSGWSVGTVTVAVGGVSGTARGANGTYTEYIKATGTGSLAFTPTNTARLTVDTVSVKRVAVAAADRVTLWAGDRLSAGVEAAGDAGLFVQSEDGTLSFIGDRWGIGTAEPSEKMQIIGTNRDLIFDGTNDELRVGDGAETYNFSGDGQLIAKREGANAKVRAAVAAAGSQAWFALDRSRGTLASPTQLLANDIIGSLVAVGYATTDGFQHGPELMFRATANWDATTRASGLNFYTVKSATTAQIVAAQLGMTGSTDLTLPQAGSKFGVGLGVDAAPDSIGHFKGANQFVLRVESSEAGALTTIQGPSTTGTYDLVVADATVHHKFSMNGGATTLNKEGGTLGIGIAPRTGVDIGASVLVGTGLNLPHVVNKAASANVRNSHDAEATSVSATYVKAKTITITNGLVGAARFLFDLKTSDILKTAYGRVYRNGVALGTEQTEVGLAYVIKSEDRTQTWNPGDTAELWIHNDGVGTTSVQNFRLAYDDSATIAVASANS